MNSRVAGFMLAALCALVPVFGRAAAPAADSAPAPVAVQGCSVDGKWQTLDVDFTNSGSKPIAKVHFVLMTASGPLWTLDDVGSYAPGDRVQHRLHTEALFLEISADIQCLPASVSFQDGTTWQNPNVASTMEALIAQTPGSHIAFSRCFVGEGHEMWFTNTAPQDATQVEFGMLQHGLLVYRVTDKGPFAPGALVQRGHLGEGKGFVVGDDMMQTQCIVLGVQYADGTSWANPSPPPDSLKGVPFTVPSPDPHDPVIVTGCDGSSATGGDYGDWRVDYQNASQKPIIAADFALVMHGVIDAAARDLHNLGPGEGNRAQFLLDDPNVFHPACMPLRVTYADGSTWINPQFGFLQK